MDVAYRQFNDPQHEVTLRIEELGGTLSKRAQRAEKYVRSHKDSLMAGGALTLFAAAAVVSLASLVKSSNAEAVSDLLNTGINPFKH